MVYNIYRVNACKMINHFVSKEFPEQWKKIDIILEGLGNLISINTLGKGDRMPGQVWIEML